MKNEDMKTNEISTEEVFGEQELSKLNETLKNNENVELPESLSKENIKELLEKEVNKLEVLDVLDEIQEPIVLEFDEHEDKKTAHETIIQIENIGIESEELLERRKKAQEKRQKNKNDNKCRREYET